MSDRLAVFNHGKVEQVGTPSEVYENPRNAFVAGFVGTSNVVSGPLAERLTGSSQAFTVRPEKLTIRQPGDPVPEGSFSAAGTVAEAVYLGMYTRYRVDIGGAVIDVASQNTTADRQDTERQVGLPVLVSWPKDSCRPLEEEPREEAEEREPALAGALKEKAEEETNT